MSTGREMVAGSNSLEAAAKLAAADVTRRMADINAAYAGDPEAGHDLEDALMLEIIRDLAHGTVPLARAMAQAFLEARDPDATRWCA